MEFGFIKLVPHSRAPTRATQGAAGYDLHSAESIVLQSGERAVIGTGLSIVIQKGYYMRIESRSVVAAEVGAFTIAGVIDSDYRGEVKVILLNGGEHSLEIMVGDRIAQCVFMKHETPDLREILAPDISDTAMGV